MLGGGSLLAKVMSLFLTKVEAKPVPSLPEELHLEILLRLPVKSTFTCKCVCKTWFKLISNPDFVKLHLDHTRQNINKSSTLILCGYDKKIHTSQIYTINRHTLFSTNEFYGNAVVLEHHPFKSMEEVHIVGSCNGLVCLGHWKDDRYDQPKLFSLWNPATNEYKNIPPLQIISPRYFFCYDYQNDDYKLVCFATHYPSFHFTMYVYTLRLNSWKSFQIERYRFYRMDAAVICNGALHWISHNVIVSFDISDESFKELQLPEEMLIMRENHLNSSVKWLVVAVDLLVLEGCLCVILMLDIFSKEAWVMQEYGVWESWTKYQGEISNYYPRIKGYHMSLLRDGESTDLFMYDPENSCPRQLKLHNLVSVIMVDDYVESLVSLNTGTYLGRTQRRGIWRNLLY